MTPTETLIETLTAQSPPVRRRFRPLKLASLWLSLAAGILLLLAIEHGVRPDLAARLAERDFALSLAAALVTGVLACIACLFASLPDRSRLWLLLPVPSLLVWVSGIGHGCLTHWVAFDAGAVTLGESLRCFSTLLLVSLPLSALMLLLLRHAAWLRPRAVTLMAGLAVAGLTSAAMALLHPLDATLMVLLWNVGAALLVVAAEALLGARLMAWFAGQMAR